MLARIKPGDSRMSLSHEEHQYHYTSTNNIITMAIAEAGFDRVVVFTFLDKIAEKFRIQYGARANSAIAYSMNTEFSLVIANEMKRANTPDKVSSQSETSIYNIRPIRVQHY